MLNLKTDAAMSNLKLNSFILLKTNISTVELPLLSYNGKLQVVRKFLIISVNSYLSVLIVIVITEFPI